MNSYGNLMGKVCTRILCNSLIQCFLGAPPPLLSSKILLVSESRASHWGIQWLPLQMNEPSKFTFLITIFVGAMGHYDLLFYCFIPYHIQSSTTTDPIYYLHLCNRHFCSRSVLTDQHCSVYDEVGLIATA